MSFPRVEPSHGGHDHIGVAVNPERAEVADALIAARAGLRHTAPSPDVVAVGQAAAIDVAWPDPVALQRDGDECGVATSFTYRCRPAAIRVVVPPT